MINTFSDGKSSCCIRLLTDGPCSEGRKTVHFKYCETSEKSRLQCTSYTEIHFKVRLWEKL